VFSTDPTVPRAAADQVLRFDHIQKPWTDFVDNALVQQAVSGSS
jgi:hypothetical protein